VEPASISGSALSTVTFTPEALFHTKRLVYVERFTICAGDH
jgi:hypothetical protein